MKRLFATACLSSVCIALQVFAVGSAVAQTATVHASQMTAMLWTHTAGAGAAMRRFIEPTEARSLWDDPQIKRILVESENAWDFVSPDGVPGFGPLPAEDARKLLERIEDSTRR